MKYFEKQLSLPKNLSGTINPSIFGNITIKKYIKIYMSLHTSINRIQFLKLIILNHILIKFLILILIYIKVVLLKIAIFNFSFVIAPTNHPFLLLDPGALVPPPRLSVGLLVLVLAVAILIFFNFVFFLYFYPLLSRILVWIWAFFLTILDILLGYFFGTFLHRLVQFRTRSLKLFSIIATIIRMATIIIARHDPMITQPISSLFCSLNPGWWLS